MKKHNYHANVFERALLMSVRIRSTRAAWVFVLLTGLLSAATLAAETANNPVGMTFARMAAGEYHVIGRGLKKMYRVRLTKEYWLQTTPVTQGQWKLVTGKEPRGQSGEGDKLPVTDISFVEIERFIAALNAKDPEATYRLPYFSEWEHVAGGSDRSVFYWGTNAVNADHVVYRDNSGGELQPVGSKRADRHGLYDLWGNVREWTLTKHNTDWSPPYVGVLGTDTCRPGVTDPAFCYPANHVVLDPRGVVDGSFYLLAGISFADTKEAASRTQFLARSPDQGAHNLGFRLVRMPKATVHDEPRPEPKGQPVPPVIRINPTFNIPMLRAAYSGNVIEVRGLLSLGADPNAKHGDWTALLYAAYFGHTEVVRALIEFKADASLKTASGQDALAIAHRRQNRAALTLLEAYTGRSATLSRGKAAAPTHPP